jgi:hypothetical protein
MRYAGDHAMWHKYVHNTELDAAQVLKMNEMDQHDGTIDFATRRGGKTACKEMYNLEQTATKPDQELGIVAPREAQSLVNLGYHLDAIRRSEMLTHYIAHKSGRKQLADTYYQFGNRSLARAYGIMAQVDGGDMTLASLEEVDDMPKDRLYGRFLLMMGSTRRLGASMESENKPQVRITGVFKGADTLTDMLNSGKYHAIGCFHGEMARNEIRRLISEGHVRDGIVDPDGYEYPLPIVHVMNGIEMGLINDGFIAQMRDQLSEDEFMRQLLCINVASRNIVWELWVQWARQLGLAAKIYPVQPLPGEQYKKRGLISFGYDHSGHGEAPQSSRYALVVSEQIGAHTAFIFARTWVPGTDEAIVKEDLKAYWRYFSPDVAIGDAYGIGMLTTLNDDLFLEGMTTIDRRAVGDGQSTASTWTEWAFKPIRFEGMVKHQMAQAFRSLFNNRHAVLAYTGDSDNELADPELADIRLFARQATNIKAEVTKASYSSYKMVKQNIGDDLFDAGMASVWGLVSRGAVHVSTIVMSRKQSRSDLLRTA